MERREERSILILAILGSAYSARELGEEYNCTIEKFFNFMRSDLHPVSIVKMKAILLAQGKIHFKHKIFTAVKKVRMTSHSIVIISYIQLPKLSEYEYHICSHTIFSCS